MGEPAADILPYHYIDILHPTSCIRFTATDILPYPYVGYNTIQPDLNLTTPFNLYNTGRYPSGTGDYYCFAV